MPFWGLVVTSCIFFVPAAMAFKKRRRRDGWMNLALATTSVAFHSTTHPVIKWVDQFYAHSYATAYLIEHLLQSKCLTRVRPHNILAFAGGGLSCLLYYGISMHNDNLLGNVCHMVLHGCVNLCMIIHIMH